MSLKIKIISKRLRKLLEAEVENVPGTGEDRCTRCGSWIEHWENLSGKKRSLCAKKGCLMPAIDGAHVYVDGNCREIYIVPLCHSCNTSEKSGFEIKADIQPVPVSHPEDE